jgi:hypothetical protein
MLGLPVMVRARKAGGRPRTLQRRVSRQVSLCGESDEKAREMHNFSAFVRGCLVGRSEGVPESTSRLLAIVQSRLYAEHFDKENQRWKDGSASIADDLIIQLKNHINENGL